jgi:hypothetical protein
MRAIDNTTNPLTLPQLDRIKSLTEELNSHQQRMKDFETALLEINKETCFYTTNYYQIKPQMHFKNFILLF